ncbi:MAG: hypothetical protein NC254_01195 [bacterium]|nr:hypothetical protein [bacterium]
MYLDSTILVNTIYGNSKITQTQYVHHTQSAGFSLTSDTHHTQSAGFSLHIGSGEDGDKMLSAASGRGSGGMTVFEPADFNPEQPVYKVCTWDEAGNRTERMVDIAYVNPHHSDEAEMFAYSCYAAKRGAYPEAADLFLRTRGYFHETLADTADWSESGMDTMDSAERSSALHSALRNVKQDWTKLAAAIMQMQYEGGNLKGYLEYKKFVDFFA